MGIFLGFLCASIAVLPNIEVGLDQELSMPSDSYVLKFFEAQTKDLGVGPPVYFVVKSGIDYSNLENQEKLSSGYGSKNYSLAVQISLSANVPNESYIATQSNDWIQDYTDWFNNEQCCFIDPTTKKYCPSQIGMF